jgi:hypothetical protein
MIQLHPLISVRPEIILRGKRKGKNVVGAIKLSFSKGFDITDEAAGYISAALHEYCLRHIVNDDELVQPELCQVFDIGGKIIFQGVKAIKKRLNDIEDECRNIAAIWPTI